MCYFIYSDTCIDCCWYCWSITHYHLLFVFVAGSKHCRENSISMSILLPASSRPALPFSFWHPVCTGSRLCSASSGSTMCCPPHRGQVPCWQQREVCFGFRVWYGQATGTNLQVRWARFEIFLSKSSDMFLYHVQLWGAWTFFCCGGLINWDSSQPDSATARAKEQEKGWHELHFLLGPCAPLGCCPVQEHIHLGYSHLLPTCHIAWDLTCG